MCSSSRDKEVHDLKSSPVIVRVIEIVMGGGGYVAR